MTSETDMFRGVGFGRKPPPVPDEQQKAVIYYEGGPARINAGAGVGKSTTMGLRIAHLIRSGVHSEAILAITFTRKGAKALVEKLEQLCGSAAKAVTVGTFHSVAVQEMLARMPANDRWHVLDEDDSEQMWKEACRESAADMLPDVFGLELFTGKKHSNKELERRITNLFSALRELRSFQVNTNKGDEPFAPFAATRLNERSSSYRTLLAHPKKPDLRPYFDRVLRRYELLKELNNGKDYDDLLVAWRNLLRHDVDYRATVQARWTHVIVDEYQDTNYLQEEVVRLLNTSHLMVVGDVAQCVYSWRSAVPALMTEFCRRYSATDLVLEHNYRSKSEILQAANGILSLHHRLLARSTEAGRDAPLLQLRGTRGDGGNVRFMAGHDRAEETNLVSGAIEKLLRNGTCPSDIAVLCRTSYYTGSLEARLRAMSFEGHPIKVQVWGGRSLLDSDTAKDVMAHFKCLARPADPAPFIRLAKLVPGVGDVAARDGFFYRMFSLPSPIALQGVNGILATLEQIRSRRDRSTVDQLRMMVSGVCEYLGKVYDPLKESDPAAHKKHRNELRSLEEGIKGAIADMAERAAETDQPVGLADLINVFSLDPDKEQHDAEALTISTVHSAKGLEWKHVFVVGASEGTLPMIRKRDEDEESTPEIQAIERAAMEEECRILYVAITRAQDSLTLSWAADNGASRFLKAVPDLAARCAAAEELLETRSEFAA